MTCGGTSSTPLVGETFLLHSKPVETMHWRQLPDAPRARYLMPLPQLR